MWGLLVAKALRRSVLERESAVKERVRAVRAAHFAVALAAAATMSLAAAAAASAEQVPGSDPPASMDGLPLAYPDQASIDTSIPPICTMVIYTCGTFETVFGQLPPSDPANGENGATDYAQSFDAWAVDATAAPADTLAMNSTYTADAYDIA